MDSKQKARELIQRFLYKYIQYANTKVNYKELAKESALICVEEIIKSYPTEPAKEESNWDISNEEAMMFWQEVKKEIEKL